MKPTWSTACLDWERRIVARESLVPFAPLFPDEAEAALKVFKSLPIVDMPHVDDGFGGKRPPTFGEVCKPWVFDFVGAIFGSYDQETGERLINDFFELISKKNIKSTMAAGIMVTAIVRNWRVKNELIIIAPTIEVAKNSADPAMSMVQWNSELQSLLRPVPHLRLIEHRTTKAELKILSADTGTVSGSKAGFVLIEEFWLFGKMANAESMLREATGGLSSRPEGFVIKLSTQSDEPPAGVFKAELDRFRDIRDGKIEAPQSLGILYEYPKAMLKSGAYELPENFYVTNPNIGASVREEYLVTELQKAENKGVKAVADFFAKHLNVEIGANLRSNRWPGAEYWKAQADASITLESILARCEVVVIGIDGGGLDDLTGLTVLGRESRETTVTLDDGAGGKKFRTEKRWLCWSKAWCHRSVLKRRQSIASLLLDFEKQGDLRIVDQQSVGVAEAVEIVEKVKDSGLLHCVAVDPMVIGTIVDALADIDVTQQNKETGSNFVVGVPQGIGMMSALKTGENKLADGTLLHADQPIMDWAIANLKIETTATAIRATKQNAGDAKIDPAMALFDGIIPMAMNPDAAISVFDRMGGDGEAQPVAEVPASSDVDMQILADPSHPRWQEMRERFERQLPSAKDED